MFRITIVICISVILGRVQSQLSNAPVCSTDADCAEDEECGQITIFGPTRCFVCACLNDGDCVSVTGIAGIVTNFDCNCAPGWEGNNCELDVNECIESGCSNSGVCTNTPGSFECNCTGTGYEGDTCTVDIDECSTGTPCDNGGSCTNTPGSFECDCTGTGYVEPTCTDDLDECNEIGFEACFNSGVCNNTVGSFTCDCTGTGYEGDRCESNIEDCPSPDPCTNGECVDGINSFSCSCDPGYDTPTPTGCSDIDECVATPGLCGQGACQNSPGSYTCDCTASGFDGPNCENNIDDCLSPDPCNNGECVDDINTFSCSCDPGYDTPTPTGCSDIDECSLADPCLQGSTCNNLPGSYECQGCPSGYVGNCDVNVNECKSYVCENGIDPCSCYFCLRIVQLMSGRLFLLKLAVMMECSHI